MRTRLFYLVPLLLRCCAPAYAQNEWKFDLRTILPPPEAIPHEGARAMQTQRSYPPGGTCDMEKVYGPIQDATLRELGYTEQAAKDSFPTFAAYWTARGWPTAELLDLYQFECAWNDWVWHTDTYLGVGPYIRANFVTQSRGWIIAPDGWFDIHYQCMTGIGHYQGRHPQVYSDRSGQNPGCTPGTCISIDHNGWSKRAPDRVCLNATAWGKDYGAIGGMAYTEGIQIEGFRLVGNKTQAGTFTGLCTGVTMNEPGENSSISYCMATDFPGSGYTLFNGTPTVIETCSAFENMGAGFDLLGSNGLCNVRMETPSGDNNRGGLIRIKPINAQSVGGGTITIRNEKSESRNVLQIPIVIEGNIGDLNLCIDGMTANFDGVTCPYLIGGNWTGTQWEVNARGIDLRSNTQALFAQGTKTLTGGRPFSGNSFVVNDEQLAFKSRSNMTLSTGPTPPPSGMWTCGTWSTCTSGIQTRTCTCTGTCDPSTKPPQSQSCTTPPPVVTMTATASVNNVPAELGLITDGNPGTFWTSKTAMKVDDWVTVDYGTTASRSSLSFDIAAGYYNSFPGTFDVFTSKDGVGFGNAVKSNVAGGYPTCTASFTTTNCRFVRFVVKTVNPAGTNWLAIAGWR